MVTSTTTPEPIKTFRATLDNHFESLPYFSVYRYPVGAINLLNRFCWNVRQRVWLSKQKSDRSQGQRFRFAENYPTEKYKAELILRRLTQIHSLPKRIRTACLNTSTKIADEAETALSFAWPYLLITNLHAGYLNGILDLQISGKRVAYVDTKANIAHRWMAAHVRSYFVEDERLLVDAQDFDRIAHLNEAIDPRPSLRGGAEIILPPNTRALLEARISQGCGELFSEFQPTHRFGLYAVSDFRAVLAYLLHESYAQFLAMTWPPAGPPSLLFKVVNKSELVRDIARGSKLDRAIVWAALQDLTYAPATNLGFYQPLVEISKEQWAIVPELIEHSGWRQSLHRIWAKLYPEKYSVLIGSKRRRIVDSLMQSFSQYNIKAQASIPLRDGGSTVGDIDVVAYSESRKQLCFFEVKELVEPSRFKEILEFEKAIDKAVTQLGNVQDYCRRKFPQVKKSLSFDVGEESFAELDSRYVVVTSSHFGGDRFKISPYPIVSFDDLRQALVREKGDLSRSIDAAKEVEQLYPIEEYAFENRSEMEVCGYDVSYPHWSLK